MMKSNTWIFQANPNRYNIEVSLQLETEELWNLNQHANKVKPGDRVLIWISGKNAGVYAVGTVSSNPKLMPDSLKGQSYWSDPKDGKLPKPRVLVKYTKVLSEPLAKEFLLADLRLQNLKILLSPQGTNFEVTDDEWQAIQEYM